MIIKQLIFEYLNHLFDLINAALIQFNNLPTSRVIPVPFSKQYHQCNETHICRPY